MIIRSICVQFLNEIKTRIYMEKEIKLPKVAEGVESATVTDILVKEGDAVTKGQSVIVVESDKASVEVPLEEEEKEKKEKITEQPAEKKKEQPEAKEEVKEEVKEKPAEEIAAIPNALRLARELGININDIKGSGPEGKILEEDVTAYAKEIIQG